MDFSKNKKGQGLPLNTIVIAILVIIVLLVIIVFFTTRIGDTGGSIDDAQAEFRACEIGSGLVSADKYKEIEEVANAEACSAFEGGDVITGAVTKSDQLDTCCAIRK